MTSYFARRLPFAHFVVAEVRRTGTLNLSSAMRTQPSSCVLSTCGCSRCAARQGRASARSARASVAHASRPYSLICGSSAARFAFAMHERAGREVMAAQVERLLGRRHLHVLVLKRNVTSVLSRRVVDHDRRSGAGDRARDLEVRRRERHRLVENRLVVDAVALDVAQQRDVPARVVVRPRIVRRIPLHAHQRLDDAAVRLIQADDVVAGRRRGRCRSVNAARRRVHFGAFAANQVHQVGGFDARGAAWPGTT